MKLENIIDYLNSQILRDASKFEKTDMNNPMYFMRKHFNNFHHKLLFKRRRTNSEKDKITWTFTESYIYLSDEEELVICQVDKMDSLQECQLLVRDITYYFQGCLNFKEDMNILLEKFYILE